MLKCHLETFIGRVLFVLFNIISPMVGVILVIITVFANSEVFPVTDMFPEFIDKEFHEGILTFSSGY